MKTLTVKIQDNFMQDFLTFVELYKDGVQVARDENLVNDPFFYTRKKQLQKDIEDIDSGKTKMLSQEQYDSELNNLFSKLNAN